MSRAPLTFKEADVRRLWKAAEKSGMPVMRTEIGVDGRIIMVHEGESSTVDSLEAEARAWRVKHEGPVKGY